MHKLQSKKFSTQSNNPSSKVLLALLLFTASVGFFAARQNFHARAARPSAPEHIASIAYYSTKGDCDPTLTLNNSVNETVNATVVLYSLEGKTWRLPELPVQLHSATEVRLREFIELSPDKELFQEGSLEVHFNHTDGMDIAVQLTVADAKHGMSYDMESPMGFKSSTLEGLWWSPDEKTSGQVMICNTTNQEVEAKLEVEWKKSVVQGVARKMLAHQTLVLDVEKLLKESGVESKGIESGGLSITHSGAPGALIAFGVIENQERSFASGFTFIDTKSQPTSTLDGTGLLLGRSTLRAGLPATNFFVPELTLKNTSNAEQTDKVIVSYMRDGQPKSESFPAQTLEAREVRMIDFNRVVNGLRDVRVENAALKIVYSGEAGSVIGALSSLNTRGSGAVDVPLVSRKPTPGKGGNHPFLIDDGVQSVAYLTNLTEKPTKAIIGIFHDGGLYTPEILDLAA